MILLLVALVSHGQAIRDNLMRAHFEDELFFQYMERNIHSLDDCFKQRSYWPGLYRPISTNLYYYAGSIVFGRNLAKYHLFNLSLFLLSALLLVLLSVQFVGEYWAILPGIIWISRSANAEVISNTAEAQVLLSVLFSLAALKVFVDSTNRQSNVRRAVICSLLLLALLSKESAAIMPFIFLVYVVLFRRRPAWKLCLLSFGVVLVWALGFLFIVRALIAPEATGFRYSLSLESIVLHYVSYFCGFSNYLVNGHIVMSPFVLQAGRTPLATCFWLGLLVGTVSIFAMADRIRGSVMREIKKVAFGFSIYLIAISPFVFFEGRFALRYCYFAHSGLALCCAVVARGLVRTGRSFLVIGK